MTILLILLAVVLVTLIFRVVIPLVKNNLNRAQECYEVSGKIEIDNELGLVCYNILTKKLGVTVHYGSEVSSKLKGVAIEVKTEDGSSNTFKIENQGGNPINVEDVSMYNDESLDLELPPEDNTERTYLIDVADIGIPKVVNLYPIVKSGKICDKAEGEIIKSC